MRKYKSTPSEGSVERSCKRAIEKEPDVVYWKKNAAASFYSSNAWPDRTLYAKHGFTMLVELKKPGAEASEDQAKCHKALRDAGHIVYTIDNKQELIEAYRKEYREWLRVLGLPVALKKFNASVKESPPPAPPKSAVAKRSGSRVSTKK